MAPRPPTPAELEAAEKMLAQFDGAVFETVYEGLGETWDFNKNPVMIGIYQNHDTTEMLKYGSKTETELRDVYTFKLADDSLAAVWGSYSINRGMKPVSPGKLVRLTYNGKSDINDGDRQVKDFKVEVAS